MKLGFPIKKLIFFLEIHHYGTKMHCKCSFMLTLKIVLGMVSYQWCAQLKWRDGATSEIRELWERRIVSGSLHVLCLLLCSLCQYLGYSFLSCISHIFFPKDPPKLCWRGLFWANACWCGGSKNKSHKQRQTFHFSVSMRWGSTECWGGREQHLVAILVHWSIIKLQEWLAVNAVQDCHMLFHNHVESFTELSCHSVL